ncbi:hypothetical protein V5799_025612 [Amblyomma americanum]|uniref:Uncharacterized protein n=1 Tax=Amblyomma americanum TaxID=6943 RepID=A0AAQ4E911_AMBAM
MHVQISKQKHLQQPAANGAVRRDVNGQQQHTSAKQALQACLEELGVDDAVWCSRSSDKVYQVMFPCESGEDTDLVLKSLNSRGIGLDAGSTVGVVPCAIFYQGGDGSTPESFEEETTGFKAAQQKFLKSVTARLTVAQVVEGVRSNGELNFDFVAFILLAGMIAALGLMDNSVVSIIAAMLVSPLMGPIAAITFGIIIRDKSLVKVGLRTELFGLCLCLVFGFVFGLIMAYWGDIQGPGGWGPNTWPNSEQTARGQWRSLWVGALVALPSGAGVAMAILGGNSACLVGVAISASLLPPSINCGSLWALSLMKVFKSLGQDPVNVTVSIPGTELNRTVETYPAFVAHPGFQAYYFDNANMHKECAVMAINSFCLTVVNILCIIIAGTLLLKIKEIAPESSMPRTQRFWKHDIKVARDYNRTLHESDLGQEFLQEWAKVSGVDPKVMSSDDPQSRIAQLQTLQDILMDAEDDEVYQTVTRHLASQPASLARRLTMVALPGGGLPPCADPADVESGLRRRRGSQMVSNMLHNYERRSSKCLGVHAYDNPSPVRDALSPPPAGGAPLSRRRSSVQQRASYWPSRFSVGGGRRDVQDLSRLSGAVTSVFVACKYGGTNGASTVCTEPWDRRPLHP